MTEVHRMAPRTRRVVLIVLATMAALAAGCATANGLREAQDAFSRAAIAETRARAALEPKMLIDAVKPGASVDGPLARGQPIDVPADPAVELAVARAGYAATVRAISAIEGERQLKADKLLGTALTLKALAQWRLGLYAEAVRTAERADREAGDQLFPRDRALVVALPGLIRNDEAFRKIYRDWPAEQRAGVFQEVLRLLDTSHAVLQAARATAAAADATHPVLVYLIQSQLATYQNRRDAYQYLQPATPATSRRAPAEARKQAQADYCALKTLFVALGRTATDPALVNWAQWLVLTDATDGPPAVPCPPD